MMAEVFIGLGSNLANPYQQLQQAVGSLKQLGELLAISSCYESEPWGEVRNQAKFLNAVVQLQTSLTPLALLKALQLIEKKQKRVRTVQRNGPRTIDLDILLFDQLQLKSTQLTIPHRYLTEREFVVYPLLEIAPQLILPTGESLQTYAKQLARPRLQKLFKLEFV